LQIPHQEKNTGFDGHKKNHSTGSFPGTQEQDCITLKPYIMTNKIVILLLALTLTQCSAPAKPASVKSGNPELVILIYDISASNDSFAVLKQNQVARLVQFYSKKQGVVFYGLKIKANSADQEIIREEIKPFPDTLELKGTDVQRNNKQKKNAALLATYYKNQQAVVAGICIRLLYPKTEPFSDIHSALTLASDISRNEKYSGFSKSLILISDCIHDIPPKDGPDPMKPVRFDDVKLTVVRPAGQVSLPELFGRVPDEVIVSIEDLF
jgi:hypothetical protein